MNRWVNPTEVRNVTHEEKLKDLNQRIKLLQLEEVVWHSRLVRRVYKNGKKNDV